MSNFKLRKRINANKNRLVSETFAGILYRKSISAILPSTASQFYNNKLKKKFFEKFKFFVFQERTVWRLELRSKVHYSYKTKLKSFRRWQLYSIQQKETKIKAAIADFQFAKTTKKKYFVRLAYYPIFKKVLNVFELIVSKLVVFLFINFNILQLKQQYLQLREEYLLKFYANKKQNLRYSHRTLLILKRFVRSKRVKRENYAKAMDFLKRKSFPDFIGKYFNKWKCFADFQILQRENLEKVQYFHRFKTCKKYLKKLIRHKDVKQINRYNRKRSETFYVRKMLVKGLKQLKNNVTHRKQIKIAENHCRMRLKKKSFVILRLYCLHKQKLNENFVYLRKKFEIKQKRKLFHKLLAYKNFAKKKQEKNLKAIIFYRQKLMFECFERLRTHTNYCLNKNQQFGTFEKRNLRIMRRFFLKWKIYKTLIFEKQLKNIVAEKHLRNVLLRKHFSEWKRFLMELKQKNYQSQMLVKKKKFILWKKYVEGKKIHENQIKQAHQIYRRNLLKEGISIIIRAGIAKRNHFERLALKKYEKDFHLSIKYCKIWKEKVFSKENRQPPRKETNKFVWNPLCFQKPKIPAYLQQKNT